ncbi:MAG: bifunctional demethylmenaquinone methyltransferase/2-methoxy-6-polyprenyl,4-benzoquinol methylase [Francisellaceae bacterium]|nr:bifunctional demethylmenaquinone methyltransferase/2-methoxy-6-polyprenyl,4-benzoquinol methylase [Francisellaceae bacterium]
MASKDKRPLTDFGFQLVSPKIKTQKVKSVFESVAPNYDLMNDCMSGGLHRLWKKIAIHHAAIKPNQVVLDLAGGTGDLTQAILPLIGIEGKVILSDINAAMLIEARKKLINKGLIYKIHFIQADAESLPFPDAYFDCIIIGFGLRNITDKARALKTMYKILKPGGRLVILEFSKPSQTIKPLYDFYSFKIIPLLGKLLANDSQSYQYLAESIRMHPDQETLKNLMNACGFINCTYQNLTFGIVAIHMGFIPHDKDSLDIMRSSLDTKPSLNPPISIETLIEKFNLFNYYLKKTYQDNLLTSLNNSLIKIEITSLPIIFFLHVIDKKIIAQLKPKEIDPDIVVSGNLITILNLLKTQNIRAAITQGLYLEGNNEKLEQLHDFFSQFEWDTEECLSLILGDKPAHLIMNQISFLFDKTQSIKNNLLDSFSEHIQFEQELTPAKLEMENLIQDIIELRDGIERLEARLNFLNQNLIQEMDSKHVDC